MKFKISERETQDGDIHVEAVGVKFLECDEVNGPEVKDIGKVSDRSSQDDNRN